MGPYFRASSSSRVNHRHVLLPSQSSTTAFYFSQIYPNLYMIYIGNPLWAWRIPKIKEMFKCNFRWKHLDRPRRNAKTPKWNFKQAPFLDKYNCFVSNYPQIGTYFVHLNLPFNFLFTLCNLQNQSESVSAVWCAQNYSSESSLTKYKSGQKWLKIRGWNIRGFVLYWVCTAIQKWK